MAKKTTIDSTTEKPLWKMRVRRGDTWPAWSFIVKDGSGNPRDLTGAAILMQIKEDATSSLAKKTLTEDDGLLVDELAGKVTFDTEVDLAVGVYVADLQITYATGQVKTYFDFQITVDQDASR